jgi:hypothetical protein
MKKLVSPLWTVAAEEGKAKDAVYLEYHVDRLKLCEAGGTIATILRGLCFVCRGAMCAYY